MAEKILTALAVFKQQADAHLSDGGGLFIKVESGTATGAFRFTSPTMAKRREMGLKPLDRSSLASTGESLKRVRAAAALARRLIDEGRDPIDAKRAMRAQVLADREAEKVVKKAEACTLARHARRFHESTIETDPKMTELHKRHWISSLENHVGRTPLWKMRIDAITAPMLLEELAKVRSIDDQNKRIPETLSRIVQRLSAVFEDAQFHSLCTTNPAAAIKRKMRPHTAGRKGAGFRFLPPAEVPPFMATLRECEGIAALALEFLILTASRTAETLGATWAEIDTKASTWVIPASRMKAGERGGDHTVHLSGAALAVLARVKGLDATCIFPSPMQNREGKPLSNMALLATLDRLGMRSRTVVHGFRRSFSTTCNEYAFARPDAIEAALAHSEQDVIRKTYNRAEFLQERRILLQRWADYCNGDVPTSTNVLPFAVKGAA